MKQTLMTMGEYLLIFGIIAFIIFFLADCRSRVYKHIEEMRELKEKAQPHFQTGPSGPRSFNIYVDDSEMILNGYTASRDDNGKESWQSNLTDNITLAKMRAIAAGVGLKT